MEDVLGKEGDDSIEESHGEVFLHGNGTQDVGVEQGDPRDIQVVHVDIDGSLFAVKSQGKVNEAIDQDGVDFLLFADAFWEHELEDFLGVDVVGVFFDFDELEIMVDELSHCAGVEGAVSFHGFDFFQKVVGEKQVVVGFVKDKDVGEDDFVGDAVVDEAILSVGVDHDVERFDVVVVEVVVIQGSNELLVELNDGVVDLDEGVWVLKVGVVEEVAVKVGAQEGEGNHLEVFFFGASFVGMEAFPFAQVGGGVEAFF